MLIKRDSFRVPGAITYMHPETERCVASAVLMPEGHWVVWTHGVIVRAESETDADRAAMRFAAVAS